MSTRRTLLIVGLGLVLRTQAPIRSYAQDQRLKSVVEELYSDIDDDVRCNLTCHRGCSTGCSSLNAIDVCGEGCIMFPLRLVLGQLYTNNNINN